MASGAYLDDRRKIGIGLTGFGVLFTFLGIMLFFDKGLLAMGNLLFLVGVTLTIGSRRAIKFFASKRNWKGSAAFLGGLFLVVFVGWVFTGMMVELYGFVVLFSGFFPTVIMFLRRIPVIGSFLQMPGVRNVVNKMGGKECLPV
mmetsp:Transcript_8207/g.30274  ORF Transcript_8207/g.30274 Transcript_8207/m.30274 type:complete len:144 (-) Transcript_8207:81-512(-)